MKACKMLLERCKHSHSTMPIHEATTNLICCSHYFRQCFLDTGHKRRVLSCIIFQKLTVSRVAEFARQIWVFYLQSQGETLIPFHHRTLRVTSQPGKHGFRFYFNVIYDAPGWALFRDLETLSASIYEDISLTIIHSEHSSMRGEFDCNRNAYYKRSATQSKLLLHDYKIIVLCE